MHSDLQRLHEAIASAIDGMSLGDLTRHPEGKWSAAEVLEHLYLTYRGTVKGLERCLQQGKPLARTPNFPDRVKALVVVGLGYMPEGRRAVERTTPRGTPAEEVVRNLRPQIALLDDTIAQCESRFGEGTRVLDHPVLGPLTGQQWRKFHWVHGRHHVKQIWKLRGGR
jgi:hypothetical protein